VRQRQVTPQELLEAAMARVEARDGTINAVVTKMYDQAKAAIAAGLPAGPFTGVPFMLKDLGCCMPEYAPRMAVGSSRTLWPITIARWWRGTRRRAGDHGQDQYA
jgi:hypothetical protein